MLVSIDWLKEHQSDQDVVILDTRPKTMFLYGHVAKSQSLTLDQVIEFDQYGSNLVLDEKKIVELFGSLGIDDSKTIILIGESMDPSVARIAWTFLYFGHEKIFVLDANVMTLQKNGFELTKKLLTPTLATFIPKINSKIRINSDSLKENLDDFVVLDANSSRVYGRPLAKFKTNSIY